MNGAFIPKKAAYLFFVLIAAVSISALIFLWQADKNYKTAAECSSKEKCECMPNICRPDDPECQVAWNCVRPWPKACFDNFGDEQKTILEISFMDRRGEKEKRLNIDLCSQGMEINNETVEFSQDKARRLVEEINRSSFLQIRDRAGFDPGAQDQGIFMTVKYRPAAGEISVNDSYTHTVSCRNNCSPELLAVISKLNEFVN